MRPSRHLPRRSLLLTLAMLLVAALALGACGSDDEGGGGSGSGSSSESASKEPIKVGSLFSVTGPPAVVGEKMRKGLELAIDEINAAGGVAGRKLELVFYDPAADTNKAIDQTRRLISRDKVDVVVGGGSQSGIALAMQPLLARAGILFMATEGAREIVQPIEERRTTFKATFNDTVILQRLAEYLSEQGVGSIGFLPDTSGFGESAKAELEKVAPEAGLKLSTQSFDPTATDLTPQLTKLRRTKPGAYVAWTTTPAGTTFLKNARRLGIDGPVGLGFGSADPAFYEQAGAAGKGALLAAGKLPVYDLLPDDDPVKEVVTKFVDAYQDRYDEPANVFAAQAYDGMKLVAKAIEATGGDTSADALAKALESPDPYLGVNGEFKYTAEDHSGLGTSDVAISEWDGKRFVPADGGGASR